MSPSVFSFISRSFVLGLVIAGCHDPLEPPAVTTTHEAREAVNAASAEAGAAPAPVTAVYPWGPTSTERLDVRYRTPKGFTRDAVKDGSFASFLRTLPLLPAGTKVVDYRGVPLYDDGHHANIAAVVDIDVGKANLQQCADAVIRLDAEWRYGKGERDIAYKSLSNESLPYKKWLGTHGGDSHPVFRSYLDDVFAWANTRSLERDATPVAKSDLRGGDFFVMSGAPFGHTVLVLDVARAEDGRLALLLGQSYMPAQSFQVLTPLSADPWFVIDADATKVHTPFWRAFPMETLHRL